MFDLLERILRYFRRSSSSLSLKLTSSYGNMGIPLESYAE